MDIIVALSLVLALFIFVVYLIGGYRFWMERGENKESAILLSLLFAVFMGMFTYYISEEIIGTLRPIILGCVVAILTILMLSIPSTLLSRK